MDVNKRGIVCVIGFIIVVLQLGNLASANVVFRVQHKFHDNKKSLNALLHHDCNRHKRKLAAAELPLGGNRNPTSVGLYFTKIQIGSPPKDYHVQVDTGSDILWVNCIECDSCPTKSDLVPMTLYDPHGSSSAKKLSCDDDFCKKSIDTHIGECKDGKDCLYAVNYGEVEGETSGYFIKDNLQLLQASGGGAETKYMTGNITFGCATKVSGELKLDVLALDGMLGLGQSDCSLVSQFASEKKVKRMFSHCLSGSKEGGGIFAIGEVVEPKAKTTKLLENKLMYNIEMKSIDVKGEPLDITKSILDSVTKQTAIVDSGATLAYFPSKIYNALMQKIMAAKPDQKPTKYDVFTCYEYTGNLDEAFPNVTLHFDDSLSLTLTPSQYFIAASDDNWWCIGFMENKFKSDNGGRLKSIGEQIILGDLVLAGRVVTYDIENNAIGWVDHDCSTPIKVKDDESGNVFEVHAAPISSARCTSNSCMILGLLLFLGAMLINWKN